MKFFFTTTQNKNSAVAEMGDRGHNRHGPKEGAAVPLSRGRAGSPSNTMWPGLRSTSVSSGIFIHPCSRLATTDKGRKLGAVYLLGGAASPSNAKSLGLRPTSLPSGILIHPAIWLQQIWAEDWEGSVPFLGRASLVPI